MPEAPRAGWEVGLYELDGTDLSPIGGGVVRASSGLGTSELEAADLTFPAGALPARFVVNRSGSFIGTGDGTRPDLWIDVTGTPGPMAFAGAVGLAAAVEPGSTPARTVSSGGVAFSVYESPGDAIVSDTVAAYSRDETWVGPGGEVLRMVRYTHVQAQGADARVLVMVADRREAISVTPPEFSAARAVPMAAVARAIGTLVPADELPAGRVAVSFDGLDSMDGRRIRPAAPLPAAPDDESGSADAPSPQGMGPGAPETPGSSDVTRSSDTPAPEEVPAIRPAEPLPGSGYRDSYYTPCSWGTDVEGEWSIVCPNWRPIDRNPWPPYTNVRLPEYGSRLGGDRPRVGLPPGVGCQSVRDVVESHISGEILGAAIALARLYPPLLGPVLILETYSTVSTAWCYGTWFVTMAFNDPHIRTFDGQRYRFQALGEFVHTRTSELEVQVRFEGGTKGRATWTTATAVSTGAHVIEARFGSLPTLVIDGAAVPVDADGTALSDGTFVTRRGVGARVIAPDGSYVIVEDGLASQIMAARIFGNAGGAAGLAGIPDGDAGNDAALRDGTILSRVEIETTEGLYGRLAASWRVRPEERLFTDGQAEDYLTDEHTSLPEAMTSLSQLADADVQRAREACRARGLQDGPLLDACVYDVAVTGDAVWADQAAASDLVLALEEASPAAAPRAGALSAAARLDAPAQTPAGSLLDVHWTGPSHPRDRIFVAGADRPGEEYPVMAGLYHDTQEGSPATLVAPPEPGDYEIRYFSLASGGVLARLPLRITSAQVHLEAPAAVSAGEALEFRWEGPNAPRDRLFVAELDWAENQYPVSSDHYHRTGDGAPARLVAPAEPGQYEIRYFSYAHGAVLARAGIEVTSPAVELDAPSRVPAGAPLEVQWSGPAEARDLIFIAPPDWAVNQYPLSSDHHHRAEDGTPARLTAPAEPGNYEVRYFSRANGDVLARAPLEITATQARLTAPARAAAGSVVEVRWQGPDASRDMIFIAPPSWESNQYPLSSAAHHRTSDGSPARLVAPAEPGSYEIRYFSRVHGAVLARESLEITAAEVRLDSPPRVAAGSTVEIPWQGPAAPGDMIVLTPDDWDANQYPTSSARYHRTDRGSPARLVAPAQPASYEIRYFSRANGRSLWSVSLDVVAP